MQNMFVYYDKNGDIKSISPVEDLNSEFKKATVDITTVEHLLTGELNPGNFIIRELKDKTFIIVEKPSITEQRIRYLDPFFIELQYNNTALVKIVNDIKNNKIDLELSDEFYRILRDKDHEHNESVSLFAGIKSTPMYFTKFGDPYILLSTINFSPNELTIKKTLSLTYTDNIHNSSVFTRRILETYSYTVKE